MNETSSANLAINALAVDLLGAPAPVGFVDPLGFAEKADEKTLNRYREAEMTTYGHVASCWERPSREAPSFSLLKLRDLPLRTSQGCNTWRLTAGMRLLYNTLHWSCGGTMRSDWRGGTCQRLPRSNRSVCCVMNSTLVILNLIILAWSRRICQNRIWCLQRNIRMEVWPFCLLGSRHKRPWMGRISMSSFHYTFATDDTSFVYFHLNDKSVVCGRTTIQNKVMIYKF